MGNNNKRKTTEQFKQEVFNLVGNEYVVNDEYVNANTKIKFTHNITTCMHDFNMEPSNFLYGQRCPKCRKLERKQQNINLLKINGQKFYNEVFGETNGEYEVIGEYLGTSKKIDILHHVCNEIFSMTPTHFKRGQRCTNENCLHNRWSNSCMNSSGFYEAFKQYEDSYEIVSEYNGYKTNMEFKHKVCGCKFQMTPNSFFNTINNVYGIKCPNCLRQAIHNNRVKTKEQFQQEIDLISNGEYVVLGEYINSVTPILMKHLLCENTWSAKPGNLLEGTGCPYCKRSRGERVIDGYLTRNNILYKPQIKFDDLFGTGGRLLSYDFYLPDYNLLIEWQGRQHKECVEYFGGQEQFEIQQEHDRRKREYAKSHGIKLLEIWYWDFDNIETILEQTLSELQAAA